MITLGKGVECQVLDMAFALVFTAWNALVEITDHFADIGKIVSVGSASERLVLTGSILALAVIITIIEKNYADVSPSV